MTDDPLLDTHRELGRAQLGGHKAQTLLIRRTYDAEVAEVWDAVTDPERLGRFFMKPTGELREGGSYQFEGNASGRILRCDPPRLLRVTWVYGDTGKLPPDEVEVRLVACDDGTVLELEHTSAAKLTDFLLNDKANGIWGLGAGWEMGLIALRTYLRGALPKVNPAALEDMPEIAEMADRVSEAWAAVLSAAGIARA